MKTSLRLLAPLSTALLLGCPGDPPVVAEPEIEYADIGPSNATVSGFVYDPEAFFFSVATWPVPPDPGPEDFPPPPFLFSFSPHLARASIPGATVNLVDGATTVASAPVSPGGTWQATDVPLSTETVLAMKVDPPPEPLAAGLGEWEPPFSPLPVATYQTTYLHRPLVVSQSYCLSQAAVTVSDKGALEAIAQFRTVMMDIPTTVADLLDPAQFGAVVLVWPFMFSEFLDFFTIPIDGVEMTVNSEDVWTIDWAPPGALPPPPDAPPQSEMGYLAFPGTGGSGISYFAILLPPGAPAGPLEFTFTDTVTDEEQFRPVTFPPLTVDVQPGLNFVRHWAVPPDFGPGDPNADPLPDYYPTWVCLPE